MAGDTNGLATALQLLGAQGVAAGDADQADMFEAQAPLPLAQSKGVSGPQGGRPKGATNKSTDAWVRYLLGRHRSPLTVLAEIYSRDLAGLVDELQEMANKHKTWVETKDGGRWERVAIDPLAVLKLQRDAAVALAPYLHKQQPKAIEIEQRQRGVMILGDFDEAENGDDDEAGLSLPPPQSNQ